MFCCICTYSISFIRINTNIVWCFNTCIICFCTIRIINTYIIKNIDIYKYHLKGQDDKEKKHIGFVIGDKFNYSKEITSENNDGADLYSFISVCCKAIQEQQEQIKKLEKRIQELESDK